MIVVPVAALREKLTSTKGKSGIQIEIERELLALLDKRKLQNLTEPELEALFEEAAIECAMRDVTVKMRKTGKIPDLSPVKH